MKIKVKFKATKYHGGNCTFVETIEVPDDLTTVEEQNTYIDDLDKSDIIYKHELHSIVDFWRYVKKPKEEKKPSWKDVAYKWEIACGLAQENAKFWEKKANEWKEFAKQYREFIEFKFPNLKVEPVENEKIVEEIPSKKNSIETGLPVDISKNYSGGWLAPNGDFYGMDGDFVDMIHAELGDKLLELEIIPKEKDGFHNPDSWLCENGWVKIHNDWILYDGYLIAKRSKTQDDFNMPIIQAIPMTDEQREKIYLYGSLCWGGALNFGLNKQLITTSKFKTIEAPMLWKLFDF